MDTQFVNMILKVIEEELLHISNDPSLKNAILVECISIDDWIQLKFGAVNKRCLREAIELAINTSSMAGVYGIGYMIMTYGAKFISQMRLLLRILN